MLGAVRASVADRQPVDGREVRARRRVLLELDRLPAPFDTDADPVHVTGSGIVTRPDGVLLLRHKRLRIWLQPGGHLEAGEAPWDAARRESQEETGLELDLVGADPPPLHHLDVHPAGDHVHLDLRYRLAVRGDDTPRPPAGESQDVAWFGWDEAVGLADAGLAGLLHHLRPARR